MSRRTSYLQRRPLLLFPIYTVLLFVLTEFHLQFYDDWSSMSPLARNKQEFVSVSSLRKRRLEVGSQNHILSKEFADKKNVNSSQELSSAHFPQPPLVLLPPDFDASLHNRTVDGSNTFPGLFWNNQLFLLGARLTSSYEPEDDDMFVTIFGMPGDFYKRKKHDEIRCPANNWYNGENGTVLSYPDARQRVKLSVHLDKHDHSPAEPATATTAKHVEMEMMYTVSGDSNQNNVTLVWHGNLTELGLTRSTIRSHAMSHGNQRVRNTRVSNDLALRLHISAILLGSPKEPLHEVGASIFSVDIPLSTGVIGQAGPQYNPPEQPSPVLHDKKAMDVALCVAVYGGPDKLQHLQEFVTHHINVGFGQIIVGVIDGLIGSQQMEEAREILGNYIAKGQVLLAPSGLPPEMLTCEVNVLKQHFYNSCLYHAKGIAPYVGIWDSDEYWLPPQGEPNDAFSITFPNSETSTVQSMPRRLSNMAQLSSSPHAHTLLNDKNWLESNYSTIEGRIGMVGEAMAAVQEYHENAGCGDSWCYHAFPSWYVYLKRNDTTTTSKKASWKDQILPRSGAISEDFEYRANAIEWDWSKSITRTKFAFMGGIHQSGSCRFAKTPVQSFIPRADVSWTRIPYNGTTLEYREDDDDAYSDEEDDDEVVYVPTCRNLQMPGFGMVHHFASVNRLRSGDASYRRKCGDEVNRTSKCQLDEYVERYGRTVRRQVQVTKKGAY